MSTESEKLKVKEIKNEKAKESDLIKSDLI